MHNLQQRIQIYGATHPLPTNSPPHIERGPGPYKMPFLVQPVPLIRNTSNFVSTFFKEQKKELSFDTQLYEFMFNR